MDNGRIALELTEHNSTPSSSPSEQDLSKGKGTEAAGLKQCSQPLAHHQH
jgi:hypothetical protein